MVQYMVGGTALIINGVTQTTAVIKAGNSISKGDLIVYDGTNIIERISPASPEGLALKSGTGGETIDIYKF